MSADWILGEPFNIASYAFMVYIFCELVNNDKTFTGEKLIPGKLIISLGDIHVYESHIDAAKIQVERKPFPFPKIRFNKKVTKIEDLDFGDFEILNYECHPQLNAKMVA
jgi:thymidylate synthase